MAEEQQLHQSGAQYVAKKLMEQGEHDLKQYWKDYLSEEKLKHLTELEDLNNVKYLELTVDTTHISLNNFGTMLPHLEQLKLNNSIIHEIRDLGSSLKGVDVLWMARCNLRDLNGVHALTSLRELYLAFNDVADISPLSMLEHLEILDLEGNQIASYEQVENLSLCDHLASLTLLDNPISRPPNLAIEENHEKIEERNEEEESGEANKIPDSHINTLTDDETNLTPSTTTPATYRAEILKILPKLHYLDDELVTRPGRSRRTPLIIAPNPNPTEASSPLDDPLAPEEDGDQFTKPILRPYTSHDRHEPIAPPSSSSSNRSKSLHSAARSRRRTRLTVIDERNGRSEVRGAIEAATETDARGRDAKEGVLRRRSDVEGGESGRREIYRPTLRREATTISDLIRHRQIPSTATIPTSSHLHHPTPPALTSNPATTSSSTPSHPLPHPRRPTRPHHLQPIERPLTATATATTTLGTLLGPSSTILVDRILTKENGRAVDLHRHEHQHRQISIPIPIPIPVPPSAPAPDATTRRRSLNLKARAAMEVPDRIRLLPRPETTELF